MTRPKSSALVLQGGGALGAFEFGAAQALYERTIAPDVIAGASIGAITAVLLARPISRLGPLGALEAFWEKVTVSGALFPPPLRSYASFWGNRHFFTLRPDFFSWPVAGLFWTYFYQTQPLRDTLSELVDLKELKNPNAKPGLLLSATNVREGQVEYFDSRRGDLTLDYVVASGSLPGWRIVRQHAPWSRSRQARSSGGRGANDLRGEPVSEQGSHSRDDAGSSGADEELAVRKQDFGRPETALPV